MVAADAGCYANSIEGKGEDGDVARLRCGAPPFTAPGKEAPETRKYGQYGRGRCLQGSLFGVEAQRYGARRGTQSLRIGGSSFMPQQLTLVENAVGSPLR